MTAPSEVAPNHPPSSAVSVELPATGSGSRRSRRDSGRLERRCRRRRALARLGKVLLVVAAVALAVTGTVKVAIPAAQELLDARRNTGGNGSEAAVDPAEPVVGAGARAGERVLLAQETSSGRLVGVTLVVVDAGGRGGDVLFVPVGSMVEVPSFGLQPLRAAYRDGGSTLLRSAVENLLGVALDGVEVLDPDGVEQLVEPVSPLRVDVPQAVEVVDGDGRVQVVFGRGRNTISADDADRLLAEQGDMADLDRLVRHEAFWRSWLSALDDDGAAPPPSGSEVVGDALLALASGPVEYHLMPVEAVAGGLTADEGLYRIRRPDLESLLVEVLPGSSTIGSRTRVQVLNGTGEPGVSQRINPLLVEAGASVTLTGNADRFDYDETQIVYYQDSQLPAARALRDTLGVGEVVKSLSGMTVVDVTVVVGDDLVADRSGDRADD